MVEQKEKKQGHKGKGQKYKSLLVWDILQKRTDENHATIAHLSYGFARSIRQITVHCQMSGTGSSIKSYRFLLLNIFASECSLSKCEPIIPPCFNLHQSTQCANVFNTIL